MNKTFHHNIPISVSLNATLETENMNTKPADNKKRVLFISSMAVLIAAAISLIAKFLIYLIDLIVNISFYGKFSIAYASPVGNSLGWWVVLIPVLGGVIVGLMALYGSKAIRGHGIPEAMEQILTNQSKIKPTITYLKPISSAISIGTGGPFGAEGPIIATGGALGSTLGQLLKISHHERKILLAAGATAGMAAIFGSPIAAIFLAIELLLFEFSPRSIIPVALACITGAAGHHLLFGERPVFATNQIIQEASNTALLTYSAMGIIIGLLSVAITKMVYLIEDTFEKLPVHWMWWPAIGGIAVGIIGYYEPKTLGVGYSNIIDLIAASLTFKMVLSLCILKFISWAIALGSGTSGGTLAPLLTIGGATGILLGTFFLYLFPESGITLSLAALVGMAAMFAGASRAFITSIIFAIETTGQTNALLPLLATCSASYFVSFFIMENTIMTEKIARRGIKTPDSYEPDLLEKINVEQVMDDYGAMLSADNTVEETINWLGQQPEHKSNYYILTDAEGEYRGIISASELYNKTHPADTKLSLLANQKHLSVEVNHSLRTAIELMANENVDVLPVTSTDRHTIAGILSYTNIISSYKLDMEDRTQVGSVISLKRKGLKFLVRGQKMKQYFNEAKHNPDK
ncbi:MAG: chloride channel protein [Bacteroidetes bacterium]|nr:chloride channel protein [Bacteroidota bacterium]MBS1539317.1 chloride channel protein [Bacteroidota bacterium]